MRCESHEAAAWVRERCDIEPRVAIILGSGLGGLVEHIDVTASFDYGDIPGFARSTVAGHAGQLRLGRLDGVPVVAMQGRFHFYEGHPLQRIAVPVRTMRLLGAETLIVTNAAGGIHADFTPGDVMLITDHINLLGSNPLIGPNDDSIGPRFPDMTVAYDPALQTLARASATATGIALQEGVFTATTGPTYETRAERRFLRTIGADACGMSTVPETIAAVHAGMRVLGFSAITNVATGNADQPPDSHEHVVKMAAVAGEKLLRLVRHIIPRLA